MNWFNEKLEQIAAKRVRELLEEANDTKREQARQAEVSQAARLMQESPIVFHVPNEWDDVLVGRLVHIEVGRGSWICEVEDALTREPSFFLGEPFLATTQKLTALAKLDPFERWVLTRDMASGLVFDKPKSGVSTPGEVWLAQLRQNGTWALIEAQEQSYQAKLQAACADLTSASPSHVRPHRGLGSP